MNNNQLFEEILNESFSNKDRKVIELIQNAKNLLKSRVEKYSNTPKGDFYDEQVDLLDQVLYNFQMNQ